MSTNKNQMDTKKLVFTAMLAAVAGVLMSLEFPLPMMPPFYKVDFSDVPTMIAVFLMGPLSGACVEIIKVLIKLFTVGTSTMYVGEVANLIGIFLFVIPLYLIYKKGGRTYRSAIIAMIVSLPIRIAFSCFVNAFITLPMYAAAMELPLNDVIQMVAAVNPRIHNLTGFIVLATIPFNFIKNGVNCLVGFFLFSRLCKVNFIKTMTGKAAA